MKKIFDYIFGTKFQALSVTEKLINYYYNDPLYKDLVGQVSETSRISYPDRLEVKVEGYVGGGHDFGTIGQQAAQCKVTIDNLLNYITRKMIKCPKHWASKKILLVKPRAGKDLNAYYDRRYLKFFADKNVYAASSSDIIAHELGHAILDALRPDLFNVMSTEIWAFHEAFGDCMAVTNLLQHDIIIDKLLKTNSLNKSNIITRIAEELGVALGRPDTLRDAFNSFVYSDPRKLDKKGELTSEPHNFSRLFTGAWYDLLVKIYETNISLGLSQKKSLEMARDIACEYLMAAVVMAPSTTKFYNAIANQMIVYDRKKGGNYQQELAEVFGKRKIYEPAFSMQCTDVDSFEILKKSYKIDDVNDMYILKSKNEKQKFRSLNVTNKLYSLDFEVANESAYIFDKKGKYEFSMQSTNAEAYDDAFYCLDYINSNKSLLNNNFIIDNNKILRNSFNCCGGSYGAARERDFLPGRGPKPENHGGCGCGKKVTVTSAVTRRSNGCSVGHNIGGGGSVSVKLGSDTRTKIC